MMSIFKKIIHNKFLQSFFFPYTDASHFEITQYRDWLLLIFVGVCLGVVFISAALYLFFVIHNNGLTKLQSYESRSFELVDEEKLNSILMLLEKRKEALRKLERTPPTIIDPSL